MNKLKTIALSVLFTLIFIPAAWADEAPTACPKVDMIKKTRFMGIDEDKDDNLYVAYQISKYETPATWAFIMGVPSDQATTKGDAMNKAKAALATLSGNPTPMATNSENNQWYCLYENDYQYLALSVTPLNVSSAMPRSIFKIKK